MQDDKTSAQIRAAAKAALDHSRLKQQAAAADAVVAIKAAAPAVVEIGAEAEGRRLTLVPSRWDATSSWSQQAAAIVAKQHGTRIVSLDRSGDVLKVVVAAADKKHEQQRASAQRSQQDPFDFGDDESERAAAAKPPLKAQLLEHAPYNNKHVKRPVSQATSYHNTTSSPLASSPTQQSPARARAGTTTMMTSPLSAGAAPPISAATSPPPPNGGDTASSPGSSSRASPRRKSVLQTGEVGLNARFVGSFCNATKVRTVMLMVGITRTILSGTAHTLKPSRKNTIAPGSPRGAPEGGSPSSPRQGPTVITTVDMSGTVLGLHGLHPPLHFDNDGNVVPTGDKNAGPHRPSASLWLDEGITPQDEVEKRSLALSYLAPCLYLSRPSAYSIREFTADNCDLNDYDAYGLAEIMRGRASSAATYSCVLEVLSLRDNGITDVGADYLKKAIKYHRALKQLKLEGNKAIKNKKGVLDVIEERLVKNRKL